MYIYTYIFVCTILYTHNSLVNASYINFMYILIFLYGEKLEIPRTQLILFLRGPGVKLLGQTCVECWQVPTLLVHWFLDPVTHTSE